MKCYACSNSASYAYHMVAPIAMCKQSYIPACSNHIDSFLKPWYEGHVNHLSSCIVCSGIGLVNQVYWDGLNTIYTDNKRPCPGCDGKCVSVRALNWIRDNPMIEGVK